MDIHMGGLRLFCYRLRTLVGQLFINLLEEFVCHSVPGTKGETRVFPVVLVLNIIG